MTKFIPQEMESDQIHEEMTAVRKAADDFNIFVVSVHLPPFFEDRRIWGFFHTFYEARQAVAKNAGSMDDLFYTHLVIEEVTPGIGGNPKVIEWYTYQEKGDTWVKCETPQWAKWMAGFGIG